MTGCKSPGHLLKAEPCEVKGEEGATDKHSGMESTRSQQNTALVEGVSNNWRQKEAITWGLPSISSTWRLNAGHVSRPDGLPSGKCKQWLPCCLHTLNSAWFGCDRREELRHFSKGGSITCYKTTYDFVHKCTWTVWWRRCLSLALGLASHTDVLWEVCVIQLILSIQKWVIIMKIVAWCDLGSNNTSSSCAMNACSTHACCHDWWSWPRSHTMMVSWLVLGSSTKSMSGVIESNHYHASICTWGSHEQLPCI